MRFFQTALDSPLNSPFSVTLSVWRESKRCLIKGCLNSTKIPKVGIPKAGFPNVGIPKPGIPKVGKTHTGTLAETALLSAFYDNPPLLRTPVPAVETLTRRLLRTLLRSMPSMGSQHPSPNVKTLCNFETQIWLEMITSRDAKSACFKGSRTSCREIIFGIFGANFGQKRSHHVMDVSCWL